MTKKEKLVNKTVLYSHLQSLAGFETTAVKTKVIRLDLPWQVAQLQGC